MEAVASPPPSGCTFLLPKVSTEHRCGLHAGELTALPGRRYNRVCRRGNDQWRLILRLEDDDDGRVLVIVEVVDYH